MENENIINAILDFLNTDKKTAILCIGNILCGDDAAGMKIAERISGLCKENEVVFACSSAPENFTGAVKDFMAEKVLLIDAACMGKEPGTISLIKPEEIAGVSFSTHMLPLKYMTDYLKASLSCEILLAGIEPCDCSPGTEMSEAVKSAVEEFSDAFLKFRR